MSFPTLTILWFYELLTAALSAPGAKRKRPVEDVGVNQRIRTNEVKKETFWAGYEQRQGYPATDRPELNCFSLSKCTSIFHPTSSL